MEIRSTSASTTVALIFEHVRDLSNRLEGTDAGPTLFEISRTIEALILLDAEKHISCAVNGEQGQAEASTRPSSFSGAAPITSILAKAKMNINLCTVCANSAADTGEWNPDLEAQLADYWRRFIVNLAQLAFSLKILPEQVSSALCALPGKFEPEPLSRISLLSKHKRFSRSTTSSSSDSLASSQKSLGVFEKANFDVFTTKTLVKSKKISPKTMPVLVNQHSGPPKLQTSGANTSEPLASNAAQHLHTSQEYKRRRKTLTKSTEVSNATVDSVPSHISTGEGTSASTGTANLQLPTYSSIFGRDEKSDKDSLSKEDDSIPEWVLRDYEKDPPPSWMPEVSLRPMRSTPIFAKSLEISNSPPHPQPSVDNLRHQFSDSANYYHIENSNVVIAPQLPLQALTPRPYLATPPPENWRSIAPYSNTRGLVLDALRSEHLKDIFMPDKACVHAIVHQGRHDWCPCCFHTGVCRPPFPM
ncbi:uncharacterized protein PV09_04369, partial [Verruconis gallopava]